MSKEIKEKKTAKKNNADLNIDRSIGDRVEKPKSHSKRRNNFFECKERASKEIKKKKTALKKDTDLNSDCAIVSSVTPTGDDAPSVRKLSTGECPS